MEIVAQVLFILAFAFGVWFFVRNINRLRRNINLGKDVNRSDQPKKRFSQMARVALGQSQMVRRPIAGIMHIFVYVGFVIINIEILEIIIDGIFGTHRLFAFMGGFYDFLIGFFEILAFLVLFGVIVFWLRRNVQKLRRFFANEMEGWPKNDGNNILIFEVILMVLFLTMNASDYQLQLLGAEHYTGEAGIIGSFPISQFIQPLFEGISVSTMIIIERAAWWLHILGILFFLNYLYYSKHLHIILAFPNVYYAKLTNQGEFDNLDSVWQEVKMMMDPDADPFAADAGGEEDEPEKFGASDITDLNWAQLLNSYTCTECGRCTSECPANQTGKLLSPRKIMMDTRDRVEEMGKNIDKNGEFKDDGKQLLDDYVSREELWACTTCNACVEACPIGIDPLSIIMDMRRYLVMEKSDAPSDLNAAMGNIENNGAPWPYNQQDRLDWAEEN
jgi:hypothetical protein